MAVHVCLAVFAACIFWTVPGLRTPMVVLMGLAGAAAVLTGVCLNRPAHRWPWSVLAAGLPALAAGTLQHPAREQYTHASNLPFWPADAFPLALYPLVLAGLLGFVRYRRVDRDLPGLLDALIVTAGSAVPLWAWVVRPASVQQGLTGEQRVLGVAHPLGDVLVLAVLVLLAVRSPVLGRERSLQLLGLGTVTLLGLDIAHGVALLDGTGQTGTLLDSGRIVLAATWGLAALHPSMRRLTDPETAPRSVRPPWHRIALLAVAALVAPSVLLLGQRPAGDGDTTALAAFAGLVFLLVILRIAHLTLVVHRTSVARERTLRAATASLGTATGAREIEQSCVTAVTALFGPRVPHATVLLSAQRARQLCPAPTRTPAPLDANPTGDPRCEPAPAVTDGALVLTAAELGPDLATRLGDPPAALLCPLVRADRPTGDGLPGALLVAGPDRQLTEIRGTLEILAAHAGLAAERAELRQEIAGKESEAYFQALLHNPSDVIIVLDDDTIIRYATPSAGAVFGSASLTGRALRELVDPRDRDRVHRTLSVLRGGEQDEAQDHWWVLKDSGRIEVEVRCRDLRADRTVQGLVITLRDVTEQRQLEHELTQRAFHDSLTGLPNRTLLLERTERALLRGRREAALTCLLFIDLDDFKTVNDTLGHSVGDQLLAAVGERLTKTLRRTDTAARLGGDEFAVLMEGARQPVDAELLAAQVIQSLNRPFQLAGDAVNVTASVGVATARDSTDTEELLALADLALYAAKSTGKRQWRRFQPELREKRAKRQDLRVRLGQAIEEEEFSLLYQPVVDLTAGEIVGFEALARWPDHRRGLVPPLQFIPLAEETGQITPLGAWVLRNAAADLAWLHDRTPRQVRPYVSVNVSARQWRDTGFLTEVRRSLDTAGLRPESLQLELTESVLVRRDDHIDGLLRTLKDMGVSIAVDDFGTGFSSLRYLRDFPIDVLKIDKTFIDDIPGDPRQVALVEGILHLADTLGLQVIAEGIEGRAQRELLAGMGCRFGQGFLFAPPMNLEESEAALLRHDDPIDPIDPMSR